MSRATRIGDFIREEISNILKTKVRDPRVTKHLTINDVVVSKDLSHADVYVSSFEYESRVNQEIIIEVLNNAAGFFRTKLSKRLIMRSTPKLKFHYDTLTKDALRIEDKIVEARSKDLKK